MEDRNKVKLRVVELMRETLRAKNVKISKKRRHEDLLRIIANNSPMAVGFVCLLEDEFNIEISDEDICMEFFGSLEYITDSILRGHQTDSLKRC